MLKDPDFLNILYLMYSTVVKEACDYNTMWHFLQCIHIILFFS